MPKIKTVSLDEVIQQAEDLLSKMTNRQAAEAVRAALSRLQQGESSLSDELKTYGSHLRASSRQFYTASTSTDGITGALSDVAHNSVLFVKENKPLWGLDEWKAFVAELRDNAQRLSEETNAYVDGIIEPVKRFCTAADASETAQDHSEKAVTESSTTARPQSAKPAAAAVDITPAATQTPVKAPPPAAIESVAPKSDSPATVADDDLTALNGVGPALQKKLKDHGITSYAQIAGLNADDIAHLESDIIKFSGRIERDDWVGQAKQLLAKQ